jgi:hypothetical protein
MISFPLLCLINKTTVDLALTDLLNQGVVSFKEWTSHRCLINGDDLLYRDFEQCPGRLLEGIVNHGVMIGLQVNTEKTMVDAEHGEINSTVFLNGVEQKKTNVAALFMGQEVKDVIGFANRSTRSMEGFKSVIWRNRGLLSRQRVKLIEPLPFDRFNALIRWRAIRPYLKTFSGWDQIVANLFPVEPVPDGYNLSREEEIEAITLEVKRLRSLGQKKSSRVTEVKRVEGTYPSLRKALGYKEPAEDKILSILVSAWKEKAYQKLLDEDLLVDSGPATIICGDHIYSSAIDKITCIIRSVKKRMAVVEVAPAPGRPVPVWGDYVPLD